MRLTLNFVPMCTRVCWHTHVHSCVHMHAQAHTRVGGVHAHTSAHTCVLAHVRVPGRAHMRACARVCRRVLARAWMRAGVCACVCWRVPPSSARLHPLSLGCSRRRRPLPRLGAPPGRPAGRASSPRRRGRPWAARLGQGLSRSVTRTPRAWPRWRSRRSLRTRGPRLDGRRLCRSGRADPGVWSAEAAPRGQGYGGRVAFSAVKALVLASTRLVC